MPMVYKSLFKLFKEELEYNENWINDLKL
jgi:hypothetical protein